MMSIVIQTTTSGFWEKYMRCCPELLRTDRNWNNSELWPIDTIKDKFQRDYAGITSRFKVRLLKAAMCLKFTESLSHVSQSSLYSLISGHFPFCMGEVECIYTFLVLWEYRKTQARNIMPNFWYNFCNNIQHRCSSTWRRLDYICCL